MKTIDNLIETALKSKAINHEFLKKFGNNEFENMERAISILTYNYYEYSVNFQRYLCALIAKIEDKKHRVMLLENLFEEAGNLHEEDIEQLKKIGIEREWVDGIDHPTLFKDFLQKVKPYKYVECGKNWSKSFLTELLSGSELNALGMLSVGTESIVNKIYADLLKGLRKTKQFTEKDIVFFSLHSEIDDEHGEIMINILRELIEVNPDMIGQVENGVNKAIALREQFWDGILEMCSVPVQV